MSFFNSFFGGKHEAKLGNIQTPLDLVTSTAGLVSNISDIDLWLDSVRSISSRQGTNQELSDADVQTLFGIYIKIEQYLITKEPIRAFSKDELRARLTPAMRARLEVYEHNKNGV